MKANIEKLTATRDRMERKVYAIVSKNPDEAYRLIKKIAELDAKILSLKLM